MNEINKSDEIIPEVSDKEKTDETIEKPSSEMPEKQGEFTNKQIKEKSKELASQKTEKKGKKSADTKQEKDTEKPLKKKGDFQYIVRIADTDIDGNKNIIYGLTKIKGIGFRMSVFVVDAAGIERNKKIGELSDHQIEKIKVIINNLISNVPNWMLNHRKDHDTGKDNHYISASIDMQLRDNINIMKKIRSYRGIRHEGGLPVRGQRTRSNGRRGLAIGVSRKEARKKSSSK